MSGLQAVLVAFGLLQGQPFDLPGVKKDRVAKWRAENPDAAARYQRSYRERKWLGRKLLMRLLSDLLTRAPLNWQIIEDFEDEHGYEPGTLTNDVRSFMKF